MYSKFIKLVVLLSLLVCCGFAGRVLYSRFFDRIVQGKDPRHNRTDGKNYMGSFLEHKLFSKCRLRMISFW